MAMMKAPTYVSRCNCGRLLTQAMINRNECPACHYPLRKQDTYKTTQEQNRRLARRGLALLA